MLTFGQGMYLLVPTGSDKRVHHPGSPTATAYVFKRSSEAVSAEQRQTFRVSVALSDIRAQIGNQKSCHIIDFSPEGFAAIASPGFSLGSMQKIHLTYDKQTITADARVQTIKVMPTGKVRYGFLVPNSNPTARNTLQKISITFQRTQLKRLAGAAEPAPPLQNKGDGDLFYPRKISEKRGEKRSPSPLFWIYGCRNNNIEDA